MLLLIAVLHGADAVRAQATNSIQSGGNVVRQDCSQSLVDVFKRTLLVVTKWHRGMHLPRFYATSTKCNYQQADESDVYTL